MAVNAGPLVVLLLQLLVVSINAECEDRGWDVKRNMLGSPWNIFYVTGFNKIGSGSLDSIEKVKICSAPSPYSSQPFTTLVKYTDWSSDGRKSTWKNCPMGHYLIGMIGSTNGKSVNNIQTARCRKPSSAPAQYEHCYFEQVMTGRVDCKESYFVTGVQIKISQARYIDRIRCCKMMPEPEPVNSIERAKEHVMENTLQDLVGLATKLGYANGMDCGVRYPEDDFYRLNDAWIQKIDKTCFKASDRLRIKYDNWKLITKNIEWEPLVITELADISVDSGTIKNDSPSPVTSSIKRSDQVTQEVSHTVRDAWTDSGSNSQSNRRAQSESSRNSTTDSKGKSEGSSKSSSETKSDNWSTSTATENRLDVSVGFDGFFVSGSTTMSSGTTKSSSKAGSNSKTSGGTENTSNTNSNSNSKSESNSNEQSSTSVYTFGYKNYISETDNTGKSRRKTFEVATQVEIKPNSELDWELILSRTKQSLNYTMTVQIQCSVELLGFLWGGRFGGNYRNYHYDYRENDKNENYNFIFGNRYKAFWEDIRDQHDHQKLPWLWATLQKESEPDDSTDLARLQNRPDYFPDVIKRLTVPYEFTLRGRIDVIIGKNVKLKVHNHTTSAEKPNRVTPPGLNTRKRPTTIAPTGAPKIGYDPDDALGSKLLKISVGAGKFALQETKPDGSRWVIFQRRTTGVIDLTRGWPEWSRTTGAVSFNRGWSDYKFGFGDLETDYWLGLDHVHALCSSSCELMVTYNTLNDKKKEFSHSIRYKMFSVAGEADQYNMTLSGFEPSVANGESDDLSSGRVFSTNDKDNTAQCAKSFGGGWWFNSSPRDCGLSNLNGKWIDKSWTGVMWAPRTLFNTVSLTQMAVHKKSWY